MNFVNLKSAIRNLRKSFAKSHTKGYERKYAKFLAIIAVRKLHTYQTRKTFLILEDFPMYTQVNSATSDAILKTEDNQKTETKNSESVFLHRETQLKAGINEGQICFNLKTTTRTNSKLFRYDYWKWIVNFMDKLSHRNEMQEAQSQVQVLTNELLNVRNTKMTKEMELEKLRSKLSQFSLERSIALSHDSTSVNCLRLVAQENDLNDLEQTLNANLKNLNVKENELFQQFLLAIQESYEKENLHTRFLKAFILFSIVFTLVLTSTAAFIHNFTLMKELNFATDKISELSSQIYRGNDHKTGRQQSWGSYLHGYVRPLYGWAMPKK